MRFRRWAGAALMVCMLLFCGACHSETAFSKGETVRPLIVVDAGHGGVDGGAVSRDGTIMESDLNLQISQRLSLLLSFCGVDAVMTRKDAEDISSPEATSVREKKSSDLQNRVNFINKSGADVLISVHQNSFFSNPSVRGAQVFYNAVPHGQRLAEVTQIALNTTVNTNNRKNAKPIQESIYLMKEVNCAAILVECGFLSNAEEARILCTQQHQIQLALAIVAGYLEYTKEGCS